MLGVETAVWTVAATKADKWYRGVLEAAELFMVKWQKDEADASRKRHASAVWVVPKGMGRGGATVVRNPRLTKAGRREQTG